MKYYSRAGNEIPFEDWAQLFEDKCYRRIAFSENKNDDCVSTIWQGLEHGTRYGMPLIFESLVKIEGDDDKIYRYTSEAEALQSHRVLCRKHKITCESSKGPKKKRKKKKTSSRWEGLLDD